MKYTEILKKALPVVEATGRYIREAHGKVEAQQIETKSLNSLVSYVDKTAEKLLVEGLKDILPEAVFLTEEETISPKKGTWRWIIDPLDGTTNFLHALPIFAISVGLEYQGEIVLGIIESVYLQETFYASKGGGAFKNGTPIQVSDRPKLSDSLLATGFPYYDFDRSPDYLQVLGNFMRKSRGIRRYGAAAIDLAYVACGVFDGFFEYSLHPWDVAAGIILVKEAGGKISDFEGGSNYLEGKEIVASNPLIHQPILNEVAILHRPVAKI